MKEELKVKLTAWALDELPPEERSRLEAEWRDAPEAREYASQTKEFCSLVGWALNGTAGAALSDEQRARLAHTLAQAESERPKVVPLRMSRLVWSLGAAAAVVVAAILGTEFLLRDARDGLAAHSPEAGGGPLLSNESGSLARAEGIDAKSGAERLRPDAPAGWQRGVAAPESLAAAPKPDLEKLAEAGQPVEPNNLWSFYSVNDLSYSLSLDAADYGLSSNQPATEFDRLQSKSSLLAFGEDISDRKKTGATADYGRSIPQLAATDGENRFGANRWRDGSVPENETRTATLAAAPPARGGATLGLGTVTTTAEVEEKKVELAQRLVADNTTLDTAATPATPTTPTTPASSPASAPSEPAATADLAKQKATKLLAENDQLERARGLGVRGPSPADGLASKDAGLRRSLVRERLLAGAAEGVPAPSAGSAPAQSLPTQTRFLQGPESRPKIAALESRVEREANFFKQPARPEPNTEAYIEVAENGFTSVAAEPLSTFSIDVDTASYANVRRFLNQGQRPPREAVRLEEMVNYFSYDYPQPADAKPFSVTVDVADCPWQPAHRLARIGLKGREISNEKRGASNLVFLVDVSGSMEPPEKLPLVKQSLRLLVERLNANDRIAMVTYAGNSGLALDTTTGDKKDQILRAVDALESGGSTHGSAGIQQAYEVAARNFIKEGVNRVILATDGDFNVGVTDRDELFKLITDKAKTGVFLSVLGYGMGNLKDATMEMLADKGNGHYAYIDGLGEARKVLAEEMNSTLVTIAKDVKIQIEFNPAFVRSYRLLGYDNRMLAKEDFNDDKKDAGEIGAGHTVTALYELVPVGAPSLAAFIDPLKYQPPAPAPAPIELKVNPAHARETMTVKLRYKAPESNKSELLEVPVIDRETKFAEAPADFKFAASVAAFGILVKDSAHKGEATWETVRRLALEGKGRDDLGYRGEFIQLVDKAQGLAK